MPIYRAKVPGLKPLLLYADSAAKAKDQLVELEAMSAADMAAALAEGLTIWKPGDEVSTEEPALDEVIAETAAADADYEANNQLGEDATTGAEPATRKRGSAKVDAE